MVRRSPRTDPVANSQTGETASLELGRLLFHGDAMEPEERARLRADLLAYCHQDTWGLVRLLERLRGLAGGA